MQARATPPFASIVLAVSLAACAQPAPPAVVVASAPSPSAAPPPSAATPAMAAPTSDPKPTARVTAVSPGKTDLAKGTRARILFENPGKRPCRVLRYKMSWGSHAKSVTLQDLTLPPGETRERWLKVSSDDGDLDALTPEAAQVDLEVDCGAS